MVAAISLTTRAVAFVRGATTRDEGARRYSSRRSLDVIVTFPDGTRIRASALADRGATEPSFGLYLDASWAPTWPAELIEWQDFGLPADRARAAVQIESTYARAAAGEEIEVGCVGGLGRTGTVLACMAVLAGVAPNDAVDWVRSNYDVRAVETCDQADWVIWFARRRS